MAAVIPVTALQKAVEEGQATTLTELATLFEVTPSAISQALEAHGLSLQNYDADITAKELELDTKYDDMELKLLKKLDTAVTFLTDPMRIAGVLRTVNMAKRRGGPKQQEVGEQVKNVTILMPGAFTSKITVNQQKEVTEVAGRTLVTMPSANVQEMLQRKRGAVEVDHGIKKLGDLL